VDICLDRSSDCSNSSEKQEAARNIKRTLIVGGGIFFLAWFANWVITKMAGV
jgi:hypothetical protein